MNKFIEKCNSEGKQIVICAPTGIAAINIGGVTVHRVFRLPIKPLVEGPRCIPLTLKDADVLLMDEVSMARIDVFDYMSQVLVILNRIRRGMGKKDIQVILVGDFFQLPPVITDKDREVLEGYKYGRELGKGYAFQSKFWKTYNFVCIQLDEVVRQSDKEFIDNLNAIRHGDYRGIKYFNTKSSKVPIDGAILLCGTNKAVNQKNNTEYNKIKSKEFVYEATIEGEVSESDKIVPEVLKLKVGCRIMTVVNDCTGKFQNGTLGTIIDLKDDSVTIETDEGAVVNLDKYTWDIHNYSAEQQENSIKISMDSIGQYTQYPLKLAYAVTIHKSQGQTFDKVNLNPYCWDCGQLYVALSRVRNIDGLYLEQLIQNRFLVTSKDVMNFFRKL